MEEKLGETERADGGGLARVTVSGQWWCALAFFVVACGAARPVSFDDARHFRVGLDPRSEADAIESRLIARGLTRVARVDADAAVGLAMRDDEGRTVLRIVTTRGLALAVDAPTESLSRSEVGLVEAPSDLDGDGYVELLPAATDAASSRRCFALVRVTDDGGLVEVTPELDGLGGDACLEALVDLQDDGRFEVVASVRFRSLAWGRAPSVALPFAPAPPPASNEGEPDAVAGARWELVTGALAQHFFEREIRERRAALEEARAAGRTEVAYQLGVELASLARFRGADGAEQTATFRRAVEGLTIGPVGSQRVLEAVGWIERGWREETLEEEPAIAEEARAE